MDLINKNLKKCSIFDIKSKYLIIKIFDQLKPQIFFRIIKYNKKIKNKLDIKIEEFLGIEIELIPKENTCGQFIQKNNKYFHIYFNDENEEIKRNCLTKDDKVNKIRIIIDNNVDSFEKFNFFNEVQLLNILLIYFNCLPLKLERSNSFKEKQYLNINDISITFSVLKLERSISFNEEQL